MIELWSPYGEGRPMTDTPNLGVLIRDLTNRDNSVSQSAVEALDRLGATRAIYPLLHRLANPRSSATLHDTDEDRFGEAVCEAAADTLERIGTPESVAAVQAWRDMQQGK